MGFQPSTYTNFVRKLPVILLLDVSGSMSCEGRIEALNKAVTDMIGAFKNENQKEVDIALSVITFGDGGAKVMLPLTDVKNVSFESRFYANGGTPLGGALRLAKEMVENREIIGKHDYRPTVVLASDGGPNDDWQGAMESFISEGRSSKCDRWALAIGEGADENMLRLFLKGTDNGLLHAGDARQLVNFFKLITMSVTARTCSQNPNVVPKLVSGGAGGGGVAVVGPTGAGALPGTTTGAGGAASSNVSDGDNILEKELEKIGNLFQF